MNIKNKKHKKKCQIVVSAILTVDINLSHLSIKISLFYSARRKPQKFCMQMKVIMIIVYQI